MSLDHIFDESQPIYQQIVQRINAKILRGGIPAGREAAFRDRSCHDLQSEPQYGRASVFGIDPFGDRGDAAGRGDVRYPGRGNVGADGARDETGADDGFPAIGAGARDFRR